MAVISIKNKTKSGSLLVGNAFYSPPIYDSIATVTVGGGGAADVEFTSIPATYTHLQIRGIVKLSRTAGNENLAMRFNSDTGSNYSFHQLIGNGATVSTDAGATQTYMYLGETMGSWASAASMFSPNVIDILDYANTNKYKTIRTLEGGDQNGNTAPNGDTGKMGFTSGNWRNTNAITSIKIYPTGGTISEYTTFALYGIKGQTMAAGNTYTPIATTTLGTAASTFSFSSIASTYTDLVVVFSGKLSIAAESIFVRFNTNTGANYSVTWVWGNGTSAASNRRSSQTFLPIAWFTGFDSTNENNFIFNVQNYSNTTTYKTSLFRQNNTGPNGAPASVGGVGLWAQTSAINAIEFYTSSGVYTAGSTFTLYGIAAA